MPLLYLRMPKAHANQQQQAKLGETNGLDESTKQVSTGYTVHFAATGAREKST